MVTPLPAYGSPSAKILRLGRITAAAVALSLSAMAVHAAPPEIRTSAENAVPACVTPKRLMTFLKSRTRNLDARYANIAELYKRHGETWHVRWDYAFFQMAVETNFLSYKKGDGDWGDVNPKQNNFAGLGTTGGGVPGDSYPDMDTGVLAQIQHLVVYSGERIADPVGARTRLKQDDIVESMAGRNGHTTFADLSRRWASDRRYGASIEWVANSYRDAFCKNPQPVEEAAVVPKRSKRVRVIEPLEPAAALGGPDPDVDQPAVEAPPADPAPADEAAQLGLPPGSEMVQADPLPADTPAKAPSGNEPAPAEVASSTAGPVRTIWSRTQNASEADVAQSAAAAKPAATHVSKNAPNAPVPDRKPVTTAAAEPAPVAEPEAAAGSDPAPEIETATATTAEQPRAPAEARSFAFAAAMPVPAPSPAQKVVANAGQCRVLTASYGGKKVFLVRSRAAAETRYTVLTVLEGFERSMLDSYFKAHAPRGSSVGEFESKDAALAKATELCPGTAAAPPAEGAGAG